MAHILIVDDEPSNLDVAATVCHASGHTVAFAHHGKEALGLLERERFDLILLEYQMPIMSGMQVADLIRQEPALSCLPIIMMSARMTPADRHVMRAAGLLHLIAKPYRAADLRALITTVLTD